MYIFPEDIKKSYESLKVPMIIIEPLASGDYEPLAISDGFLDFHSLSRDYLKRFHNKWDNEILFERIHPEEKDKLRAISMDFLEKKTDYDITFRIRMDDGYHLMHSIGYWQTMEDGTDLAFLVYHDVQKHKDMFVEIANKYKLFQRDEFYVDALTNLPNINYVNKNGDNKIREIVARGKNPVVIYLDIDSMQSYNRRYELKRGDDLLVLVANILTEAFPHGIVARIFSDHFTVIDEYLSDEEIVKKIESVNSKVKSRAFGITTGLNVGIYVGNKNDSLKECIDHSVRANKLVGEDLNKYYRFYTEEDDSLYNHQRYIIENFYTAMDNNWIKVFYQCFMRIETGKGMGFEALARWIDPEIGMINPDDFIPALEKYHLMHEMDLYMFEAVCKEIKIRYDEGLPLLPVSINFSRQEFDSIVVMEEINKSYEKYDIRQYGIDKSYFIIEITEQGLSKATDKFHEQLKKIRENGYKLWVDDFGSGYSSLNVFSSFDIDLIKFDMSLLINLDAHNGVNRVILKGMIDIAHELGVHTLCEGMETEEQKNFLLNAGCELGQGFFYHRPESLDTILERLHKDIPIPKWESEKERQAQDNNW